MAQAPSEPVYRLRMAAELEGFYLDVPFDIASSLCLHPVKFLRFLGYCIFGVDGTIAKDDFDGDAIPDGDPLDQGVYYFVREGIEGVLKHAVDPEAMTYSHISETTNTRDNFRTVVAERDVFAHSPTGIYIVPFSKGDAWIKHIVESRIPEEREDVSNLTSINDIRNGMLVANNLHPLIEKRKWLS
ncbi:hypothetical protein B0H17DRAFT_1151420 [Mycena rosella]|uniref:HNH nuclease domain-containing protein n=1 Tax=Mycena rosella TaxID=1033263 RepID=A0AAD7BL43_MYCRO|nr:hypothetical protein B0H17DRAFT_1151420 [Mycena rosella]